MPNFFGLYAKFYWLVCQNCTLSVHRIVLMGSILFEKNLFLIVFFILGGNSSGFLQNFSSTVDRTALVPRFFFRIFAIFLWTWPKIILTDVSKLHSTCPQDCFHGKHLFCKKHFSICISPFWRIIFGFLANLFQQGSQNYICFQVFVIDFMPIFFHVYAKFHWPVCQNCTLGVHRFVFKGSIFFEKTLFKVFFTF